MTRVLDEMLLSRLHLHAVLPALEAVSHIFPQGREAIAHAEFTSLTDDFNFELNKSGANGAQFEGGWTPAKYDAFAKWIDAHPEKLKMPRSEFNELLEKAKNPKTGRNAATPDVEP